ncbi:MAG: hypothetical protein IK122_01965 [Alphaproteobacteria bacterium]|nr:hypothetical protein [Alphaproteobacteria bacterium]
MDKKSVLTSIIALGFVTPAIADFPADGLMKANQVYTGAAIHENMGVYEGTVYANAVYEEAVYNLLPGTYLPAGETAVADCISGYYCPGSDTAVTYSDSAQGLTQCPNGYNSSDSGASSSFQCYKACDSANFPNATAVSGHDYYAFGFDTCEATACAAGWHLAGQSDTTTTGSFETYIGHATGHAVNSAYWTPDGGFGWDYYGYDAGNDNGYTVDSSSSEENVVTDPRFYDMDGVLGHGLWATGYGRGRGWVRGTARLSETTGNLATANSTPTLIGTTAQLGGEGGTNCWCNITGYRWYGNENPEASPWYPAISSWAYAGIAGSLGACTLNCAAQMSQDDDASLSFRYALFQSVTAHEPAKCVANTITINWSGTSAAEINANQAGSAYYGGDVRTPRSATPVEGKIFQGWMFSTSGPSGQ